MLEKIVCYSDTMLLDSYCLPTNRLLIPGVFEALEAFEDDNCSTSAY